MSFGVHQESGAITNEDIKLEREEVGRQLGALRLKLDQAAEDAKNIVDRTAELAALDQKLATVSQKVKDAQTAFDTQKSETEADIKLRDAALVALEANKTSQTTIEKEIAAARQLLEKDTKTHTDELFNVGLEIDAAKITLGSLNKQVEAQVALITKNETKKGELVTTTTQAKIDAGKAQAALTALQQDCEKLKATFDGLTIKVGTVTKELAELETKKETKTAEYTGLVTQCETIVAEAQTKAAQIIAAAEDGLKKRSDAQDKREAMLAQRVTWIVEKEKYLGNFKQELEKKWHKPIDITFGEPLQVDEIKT